MSLTKIPPQTPRSQPFQQGPAVGDTRRVFDHLEPCGMHYFGDIQHGHYERWNGQEWEDTGKQWEVDDCRFIKY